MLSCEDAMVLTDKIGRIVHCNRPWALLTGHSLTDAEGLDYSILDGSMTDCAEINRCRGLRKALQSSVSTVVNYRKDGLMFMNSVTTSPIRGVYMSEGEKEHLTIYVCLIVIVTELTYLIFMYIYSTLFMRIYLPNLFSSLPFFLSFPLSRCLTLLCLAVA